MNILADADLPYLTQCFPKPFNIRTYPTYQALQTNIKYADILLCRSTCRVNETLLEQSPVQCVATASSGTDHIDHDYLLSNGIQRFDAKGSNAIAVADYVTATLAWLETHQKLTGKHAGLIGAGAVGTQVLKRLIAAGYHVSIYDPYRTATGTIQHVPSIDALQTCDVICIHPNLHHTPPYPSFNLINADFLSKLKSNVSIINASRGGVVNEQDLLNIKQPIHYCTDVFWGEPDINPDIIQYSTLCTPHIAGHSVEAKQLAIIQISQQLHAYYDVPIPQHLQHNLADQTSYTLSDHWQSNVLEQYNPEIETTVLKTQLNKTQAFITLRKAHTQRYHFVNTSR